jgi:AmiR/NasT family two-component response regulator
MSSARQIDFRQLRVLIIHPRDQDGELLLRHLQRLGCPVELIWPPPPRLENAADVIFCLVDQEAREIFRTFGDTRSPTVIGIVEPANPRSLQLLADLSPQSVLPKPIDRASILTSLIIGRKNSQYQRGLLTKIARLEETLRSVRRVERAKVILMGKRGIGEAEAYAYLREQAMKRRVAIGVIATAIVEANEILSDEEEHK